MLRFTRARQGYSLLELMFAIALFSLVLLGVSKSFVGMRKAQGSAVSQNLLKVAGQKAIHDIYLQLSQSRSLLASTKLDPPTKDRGREYFTIFEGAQASPAMPMSLMQFPRIDEDGAFGLPGTQSGQLEQATIGNTLVFLTTIGTLELNPPNVTLNIAGVGSLLTSKPYNIPALRFMAYYMIEKPLPANTAKLPGGQTFTRQLVRWESQPYIERGEFANFCNNLVGAPATTTTVWNWMQAHPDPNYHVAGLWDGSAATAAATLYTVDGSGNIVAAPAGTLIKKKRMTMLAQTDLDPYAQGMVAFNTTGGAFPLTIDGQTVPVPAYALTDAAHANFPYGFEVGMVGPSGARSVLVRLVLASRLNQGLHLYGISQQEVIKVFDM